MDMIVVQVPAHHKRLADALVAASSKLLEVERGAAFGRSVRMLCIEQAAADASAELERAFLQGALQELDVDQERVSIGGVVHARVGRHPMTYYTMAGEVVVERALYRPVGERNAKTVDPIAVRAGLIQEAWLPSTARAMAHRLAIGTSREAEACSKLEGRLPYSRTSFEQVAHAVGASVVSERADIEQALNETLVVPSETASIGVALDRSAMAFEEPRPRPPGRPKKGAPKRPIKRVFHMAWSGTVTLHDHEGNVVQTLHYGREPAGGASLAETLASDVLAIRQRHPDLPIVILADGAHELWNLLEPHFEDVIDVTRTVDYWHLVQKLSAAANVITSNADEVVARWKLELLNRAAAPESILAELRASGQEHALVGKARPVHEAMTYLENHAHRMRYRDNRRRGLPIGSGPVEANAKSLYTVRMTRPGARWKPDTADHVLQLRAHALSNRFVEAIDLALPKPRAVRRAA